MMEESEMEADDMVIMTEDAGELMQAEAAEEPVPCIAIAPPKAQLGQGASGQDIAVPVQNLLVAYLSGPMLNVITLQSRLPAQLMAEAKQAGCDQILTSEVSYKKKKGFGKAFSIGAGALSSALPYAGIGGGMGGYVASAAVANAANNAANVQMQEEAAHSLTTAQGTVRKGDSINLTYGVKKIGGKKAVMKNEFSAKAEQDGEDLLIPLIEQTATEVFTNLIQ